MNEKNDVTLNKKSVKPIDENDIFLSSETNNSLLILRVRKLLNSMSLSIAKHVQYF